MSDMLCHILAGRSERVTWSTSTSTDWDRLVAVARAEGVAPLVYHTLETAGWPDHVPATTRQAFQAEYYATVARNLLMYQELSRIVSAFNAEEPAVRQRAPDEAPMDHRPPIVVLKGAALAAAL